MNKTNSVNKATGAVSNTSSKFETSGKISYKEMMNSQKLAIFSPENATDAVTVVDTGTSSVENVQTSVQNRTPEQKEDAQRLAS